MTPFRVHHPEVMADLERKLLPNRVSVSAIAVQDGCAVALGLPFLAMGSFIAADASGYLDALLKSQSDHNMFAAMIGGVFASVGLWIIFRGLAGLVRNAGVRRRKSRWPGEPWYWDHPWNALGTSSSGGPLEQLQGLGTQVYWTVFIAAFNWVGATDSLWWLVPLAPFDLAILYSWGTLFYKFARSLRHGRGRLRFSRFPFFLGDTLDVELLGAEELRGFTSLTVSLRCIREAFEHETGPGRDTSRVASYQIYEDGKTLMPETNPIGGPDLRISFPLPSGDYETSLGKRPPTLWELEIKADLPGIDYAATFLLPVYARPVAS